jgi:hypothetical protein
MFGDKVLGYKLVGIALWLFNCMCRVFVLTKNCLSVY